MLKRRKGMGVGTILKLTLALMTASLFVSASTIGDLGQAFEDGMNNIQDATDFTVDVENEDDLSDAAMFVYQRAANDGCAEDDGKPKNTVYEQNQEGGYPALADSYIGLKPSCSGTSSTLIRGDGVVESGQAAVQEWGMDMEGKFSRVRFEVKNTIEIETSQEESPNWLEGNLRGISKDPYRSVVAESCDGGEYLGTHNEFAMFFRADGAAGEEPRSDKWMTEVMNTGDPDPYCAEGANDVATDYTAPNPDDGASLFNDQPMVKEYRRVENKVVLCPGDVGYIQMNKGDPFEGEAGEELFTGSAENFPYIQITNLGTREGNSCASAEMEPAGVFTDVDREVFQLPSEFLGYMANQIPDRLFEPLDWAQDIFGIIEDTVVGEIASDISNTIIDGVNGVIDGTIDTLTGWVGSLFGDDAEKTLEDTLEEEGINPFDDIFNEAWNAVKEYIHDNMGGTMNDPLWLQPYIENRNLDMDDDVYYGDPGGGFTITGYNEDGSSWEEAPVLDDAPLIGGEDIDQGDTEHFDLIQMSWIPDNSGINDLSCYVTLSLYLDRKNEPEQTIDVWIGDLKENNGGSCERDGRLGGSGNIYGEPWGSSSVIVEDTQLYTHEYYQDNNSLAVEAAAIFTDDAPQEDIEDANIEIGTGGGYNSEFDRATYDNCEGLAVCSVHGEIDIAPGETKDLSMRVYVGSGAESDQTDPTTRVESISASDFLSATDVLNVGNPTTTHEYDADQNTFDFNATFQRGGDQEPPVNLNGAEIEIYNITSSTTSTGTGSYSGVGIGPSTGVGVTPGTGVGTGYVYSGSYGSLGTGGSTNSLIGSNTCNQFETMAECKINLTELNPAGNELDLNVTITKAGITQYQEVTINYTSSDVFGENLNSEFSSSYDSGEDTFDLNATFNSGANLDGAELELINVTSGNAINNKTCSDSNSCLLQTEDIDIIGSSSQFNATLSKYSIKSFNTTTISN